MGLLSISRAATLRYDYRNQMVEYADDDYSGEPHVYVYDCFGRRVMKMVYNPPVNVPANIRIVSGGNTRGAAMAGGWQTLEEWDADGEPALYASYVYGNYIDEVLSMRKDIDGAGTNEETEDYYFHQDDLFNVVLVTDSAGDAAERYEYGDYGAPFYFTGAGSSTPSSAIGNTRLFNGREWDDETRFYYYRTRYLDPTMGRFTTRDTIGVWGDWKNSGNAQALVHSSPIRCVDPFGRKYVLPEWGEGETSKGNCYRFACDDPGTPGTRGSNPGGGGRELTRSCKALRDAAKRDGLTEPDSCDTCPAGSRRVASAITDGPADFDGDGKPDAEDYHWWREDEPGRWVHKPGSTRPRDHGPDGKPVTDPSNPESRGPYKTFCGYLCVPKGLDLEKRK